MRVTSLKVFVPVLFFGLLLGASSTAYADALVITSFSFGNLQFTARCGNSCIHTDRSQAEMSGSRFTPKDCGQFEDRIFSTQPITDGYELERM